MDFLISVDSLSAGLGAVLSGGGIAMVLSGAILGILIGATPGLSPSMGVALLVPFSYGMNPALAFIFFAAVYQAANYGGSLTAIAINAPGTPAAVVTAIDGYQLTKKGRPGEALGVAVFASAVGGLVGALVLVFFAVPIAGVALQFGPAEYFSLAIFGLATVIAFAKKSVVKTSAGVLLGLLISTVGTDPFTGDERFVFGVLDLYDGFAFIPAMIGLFALAELFLQLEHHGTFKESVKTFAGTLPGKEVLWKIRKVVMKSSLVGTFIGVIPGAGATIASFISYGQAKRASETPDEFGEGSVEGIAASEAANSSSVGGALVPLLALGIPGSATDAVLLGAFSLHGLVAGPELFKTNPDIVYGIFVSLFLANVFILLFGLAGNRLWLSVIKVPRAIIFPLILALCVLGSYTIKNSVFDAWVCVGFGVFGWILKRYGFLPAPIVLGLVLGEMVEMNFRRTILLGGPSLFFTKPISLVLLILSLLSVLLVFRRKEKPR